MATRNNFGLNPLDRAIADFEDSFEPIGIDYMRQRTQPEPLEDDRNPAIPAQQPQQPQQPATQQPDTAPAGRYAPPPQFMPLFQNAAQKYDVPINVIMALAHQESTYRPDAVGVPTQWGRAQGMMQYLDSTAKNLGINPFDPAQAINAAAMQIRQRLDKGYSMEDAVKEHFAGPNRRLWGPKTRQYGIDVMRKSNALAGITGGMQPGQVGPGMEPTAGDGFQQGGMSVMADGPMSSPSTEDQPLTIMPQTASERATQEFLEHETPQAEIDQAQGPELRAWEPTLWDRVKGMFGPNKDAATVELIMRRQAQQDGISVSEAYKRAGGQRDLINPEGRPPIQAGFEAAATLVNQVPDILPATANTILRTIRGGNISVEPGIIDKLIEKTDIDNKDADPNYEAFQGVGESLAYSLTTLVAGAISAAVTSVAGPIVAGGSAMAASGAVAFRASKDDFLSRVKENLDKESKKLHGRELDQKEWDEARKEFNSLANEFGAWEAIPESLSNLIFIKAISAPLKGAQQGAVRKVAARAAQTVKQTLPAEYLTETVTGYGQNRPERAAGLTNDEITVADAFRQQLIPTTIVTLGLGGGGAVARESYDAAERRVAPGRVLGRELQRSVDETDISGGTDEVARNLLNPNSEFYQPEGVAQEPEAPAVDTRGPLQRAMDAGEQVAAERRVVVTTPTGQLSGFMESFSEDGQGGFSARILGDDGQFHQFTHNDPVQIQTEVDAVAQRQALEQAAAEGATVDPETGEVITEGGLDAAIPDGRDAGDQPVAQDQPDQPRTSEADEAGIAPTGEVAEQARPRDREDSPATDAQPQQARPLEPDYDSMTVEQLTERLGYVTNQAMRNGGWNRRMVNERERINAALNRQMQPEATEQSASSSDESDVRPRPTNITTPEGRPLVELYHEREGIFVRVRRDHWEEGRDSLPAFNSEGRRNSGPLSNVDRAQLSTPRRDDDTGIDRADAAIDSQGFVEPDVIPETAYVDDTETTQQPDRAPARAEQTPTEQPATERDAAPATEAQDQAPTTRRDKALARIEAGRAWFGTEEKARTFIDRNDLAGTHTIEQTGARRFEVVAQQPTAETQSYEGRKEDRIERLGQAQTEEDVNAIVREEEGDPERYMEGGTSDVYAAASRRNREIRSKEHSEEVSRRYEGGEWMPVDGRSTFTQMEHAEVDARRRQREDGAHEYRAVEFILDPNSASDSTRYIVERRLKARAGMEQAKGAATAIDSVDGTPDAVENTESRRDRAFTAVFDALVDNHGWQRDGKALEKTFENMVVAGDSGITDRTITISRQRSIAEAHLGFDRIALELVPEFAQDSHYASVADRLNGKVEAFVREQRAEAQADPSNATEEAASSGERAAMQGFSMHPPSNIRKKAEREAWEHGWQRGKRKRDIALKGLETVTVGDRVAHPTLNNQNAVVWRDERAGKDYDTPAKAKAGMEQSDANLARLDDANIAQPAARKTARKTSGKTAEPNLEAARKLLQEQREATGNKKAEANIKRKIRALAKKTPISDERTVLTLDTAATRLDMENLEFADAVPSAARSGEETAPAAPRSTAPEHAQVGVDNRELSQIVDEFNDAQASMNQDGERIHHLFDPPTKSEIVRLQNKTRVYHAEHGWMTPAEARALIDQWKEHAAGQSGARENADRVVLSLFDYTGQWSQPWEDAGYQVFRFDIQHDPEVGDVHNFSTEFFNDWFSDFDGLDIYAILAACPCTDFASSGARHFAAKDKDGRTVASVRLVHQTLATIEHFRPAIWAVENPVGRIERLGGLPPWRLSFDPNHIGDPYTKKTLLWGRFNADLPIAPVEPTEGSKMHSQYGGSSIATKNARSVTPEGFSYGFFMANNAIDNPKMAASYKYDRLNSDLIGEAIDAGMTEQDIGTVVDDHYYIELNDEAAEAALRQAITERTQEVSAEQSATVAIDPRASSDYVEFIKALETARKDLPDGFAIQPESKVVLLMRDGKIVVDGLGRNPAGVQEALRQAKLRAEPSDASRPTDEVVEGQEVIAVSKRTGEVVSRGIYRGDNRRTGSAQIELRPGYVDGRHRDNYEIIPVATTNEQTAPSGRPQESSDAQSGDVTAPTATEPSGRTDAAREISEIFGGIEVGDVVVPNQPYGNLDPETPARVIEITDDGAVRLRGFNNQIRMMVTKRDLAEAISEGLSFSKATSPDPLAPSAQETAPEQSPVDDRFANNKIFTADKVAAARARLRSKFGQLNSGIDPETLIDGMTIAGAYIESGVRNFSDYAQRMVSDLGDGVKPYLLSFWEGARNYPGLNTEGMTGVEESRRQFDGFVTQTDAQTEAVGEVQTQKPKRRRKTGKAIDRVLTQDWGIDHIDAYTDEGEQAKAAFLKEARSYLQAISKELMEHGYTPHMDGRGRPERPVRVNEGGIAVSGEVSLALAGPNEIGVYAQIGGGSLRGVVPTTPSGVAIMFRAAQNSDKFGVKGTNQWAPTDLSAAEFAAMLDAHVRREAQRNERPAAGEDTGPSVQRPSAERVQADEAPGTTGDLFGQPDSRSDGVNQRGQRQDTGRTDGADRSDSARAEGGNDRQGSRGSGAVTGDRGDAARSDRGRTGVERADDAGRTDGGLLAQPDAERDGRPVTAPRNYRIQPGEIAREGSWRATAERNVDIVELVKRLEAEGRMATPEEKALMTRFTGWGASEIANGIFPDRRGNFKPGWEALGQRLRDALTEEEYANARRSTQYAHYTSEGVIRSIYAGLERFGFKGGQVMEPGMGIGLFAGLMPDSVAAQSTYTGIEFDNITGAVAKHLYPESNVIVGDYTRTNLPANYFDAAIGNPPFASTVISNDPEYKRHRFMLHDYFFAKTIDRVRPGGLVVFVTSKGTMDKANDKARKYLAERANLVGAVRLPQTAFKDNAGTEVVTDVLFLQKRGEGIPDNDVSWLGLKEVNTNKGEATLVNEYFADNPDMVLGEHAMTGSMYRANEYTVEPHAGVDIEQAFSDAVSRLPEDIYNPERGTKADEAKVIDRDYNPTNRKEGGLYLSEDGTLMQVESGSGVEVTHRLGATRKQIALKPKEMRWLKGYVGVRDALKQAQFDQLNDGDWQASMKALNEAYDAFTKEHGQILAHSVSERESADGTTTVTKRYKNRPLWDMDAEGALVYAMETEQQDGTIVKGPIFSQRVLRRPTEPEIKTTQDAMMVSLNRLGRLDVDDVATLAGIPRDEVIDGLGTAIYEDPSSGWQTADEYLSGNVVRKLEQARAAADLNKKYARNVEALLNVQPRPLGPTDITVRLGANWVPATDIEAFAQDVLGERIEVAYKPVTGDWTAVGHGNVAASEWAAGDMSASSILNSVLNSRQIKVTYRDAEGKTHTDPVKTEQANDVARKMKEQFSRWIWTDTERANRLTDYYNEHFNNYAPRQYDGSHLTLPGVSLRFDLHPHQKRGVWRMIQDGDTYLAHAVGAGKTFTMIAGGMEQRRLGLISKPVYTVPNHMLAQFSREFLELYPTAHIMVADEQNFHTANRRRFLAQAALNNPDAIIITHSAFSRLGMSEEYSDAFIQRQINEWKATLADVDGSDRITKKQIERRIEQLERRLEGKQSKETKDQVLTFEELGADYLFVDEMHEFRKLDFATNQGNIKGIDPAGSQRALDLFMKVEYLREQKPGRTLTGASGTPITNTMGELFTVQRFFQPELLAEDGLNTFDAWAAQYGDTVTGLEQNAAGGYETVTRFAKFQNVPELMRRVRTFMDILTSNNLGELVKRPNVEGGGREIVVTPSPDGYREYQQQLEERIKAIRNRSGPPQKGDDIILTVINDGRFSAIDMRFVDPTMMPDPDSKLNRMLDDVIEAYRATEGNTYQTNGVQDPLPGSSLIVFADIGLGEQSAEARGFSMRNWIEQRLTDAGIPRNHFAFMRDHKQHAKKERLFSDMREGKKRILIGGKDMETGVNVQKRLTHLFHLDAPWFPASVEQREGRIIRQGNQNENVVVKAYATKGSYDSTMWGMNARKARFIEQAMNGDDSVRSLEDVSEASSFEMAAALASGDERYLQLAGLRGDVERLQRLRQAHYDSQNKIRRDRQWAESDIERKTRIVQETNAAIARRKPIKAGEFEGAIDGNVFDSRDEFSTALFDTFKTLVAEQSESTKIIGEIGGFDIRFDGGRVGNEYSADVHVDVPGADPILSFPIPDDMSIKGLATKAANQVNGLDRRVTLAEQDIAASRRKIDQIDARHGAPFAEEADLMEKVAQLNDLEAELAAESAAAEAATEQAQTEAPQAEGSQTTEEGPDGDVAYSAGDISQGRGIPAKHQRVLDAVTSGTLGPVIQELIGRGHVTLHPNAQSLPTTVQYDPVIQGFTERSTGNIHLVTENLTPQTAMPVLLHEAFHSQGEQLIGTPRWNNMMRQLDRYYAAAQARRAEGRVQEGDFWDGALRRVEEAQARGLIEPGREVEEFGAYAIENYEIAPSGIRKWVDRLVGMMKDWLARRFNIQVGAITPAQLRALAVAALRSASETTPTQTGAMGGSAMGSAAMRINDIVSANQDNITYSTREREQALDEANKALEEFNDSVGPAKTDHIGRAIRDMDGASGLYQRFMMHPYTVASLHKDFTPVFNTAVAQHQMRSRIIEDLHTDFVRYQSLPAAGKEAVNKVLELGRLTSNVYSDAELQRGIRNPGYRYTVRYDEQGNPRRVRQDIEAALTKQGETITLNDDHIAAYRGLRNMFDRALDMFRDQVLEEFGLSSYTGQPDASGRMIEDASKMPKGNPDRAHLENMAEFISDIEQSKRTGYVPFTRYGDYVIAVKERQADIQYERDGDGYQATGVPQDLVDHLDRIGASYNSRTRSWYLTEDQRQSLESENEITVYSEKVETGFRDMWGRNAERKVKHGERPVSEIPSVKQAVDRVMAERVGENPNRRIIAFPTAKKRPEGGIDLQSLDALAEVAMLDQNTWDSVRDELAKALKAGGFRRHFFQSSQVPGYSPDFERSTADYIVGLSGYLARRHHNDQWENSLRRIKGQKLHQYASRYRSYVNDPSEEYALMRQTGFFMYIAGNISSAALNATQVPMLTMPFLQQFSSHPQATSEVTRAYKDALKMVRPGSVANLDIFDFAKAPADVRAELQRAKDEGLLLPLQSLEIMGVANRRSVEGRRYQKAYDRTTQVFALPFTSTERLNRLVTFIAAARMSKRDGTRKKIESVFGGNPMARSMLYDETGAFDTFGFAEFAVGETQFIMGKLNRPTMMRNVGAPIMQFKSFMIQFLETVFMRWPALQGKHGKKARNLALFMMVLMAGLWGFPGGDDLRELVEKFYKGVTKKDFDSRDWLRQLVWDSTGSMWLTRLVDRGVFAAGIPGTNIGADMSQRIGLGNIMPDVRETTGIGWLDNTLAFGGIPLDLTLGRPMRMAQQFGRGDPGGAITQAMPNFVENARRSWEWHEKGVLTRDQRKMLNPEDVDAASIALKSIGFQPTQISELYAGMAAERRSQGAISDLRRHLTGNLVRALSASARNEDPARDNVLERDITEALTAIADHNERATRPEDIIELSNASIRGMMQREIGGAPSQFGRERRAARGTAEARREAYGLDRYTP